MLEKYEGRFEYVDGALKIDEGVYIVPHSLDGISERAKQTHMCVMVGDEIRYDDFSHEQTLVFEEEDGLVCFNSCSHSGVEIVIDEVIKAFPNRKIQAYVGGFHMMGTTGPTSCSYSKKEVRGIADGLMKTCDARFYSGHCTGTVAYQWLKEIMGERLEAFYCGKIIELS